MNIERIANKNLDNFILNLRKELKIEKINDTNKASNSLKKRQISVVKYQVTGVEYLELLNKGIGKGNTDKVMKQRAYAIYKSGWVRRKLGISKDNEQRAVAFAVSMKIQKEGTEIFKDNQLGIKLTQNVKKLAESLAQDLGNETVLNIKEQLNKFNNKRKR
jgi:uncharacterized protein YPO0396